MLNRWLSLITHLFDTISLKRGVIIMSIKAYDNLNKEVYARDLKDSDRLNMYTCIGCGAELSLIISSKAEKINHFATRGNNRHEDNCIYSKSLKYNIVDTNFNINSFFSSILNEKSSKKSYNNNENYKNGANLSKSNEITNLRTFVTYCRQHKTYSTIGNIKVSDCFLDQRIYKKYEQGFNGFKVVIPFMKCYDKEEKSFIMRYGKRKLKVMFYNDDLFKSLRNEYFEIKDNENKELNKDFLIAIVGEWYEKDGFICADIYKKRQISNVASIINVT